MKSTTFALGGLLGASVAVAQHAGHQAFHHHQKREAAVEWVTQIEYTTEVVDFTTTIWVSEGYTAPAASTKAPASTTGSAAQFFQPAVSSSSSSSSTTSVYVAPTPSTTSTPVATTSSYIAPVVVAPVVVTPVTTSSSTPAVVESTVAPSVAVVATTSSAVAAVASSSSTITSNTDGLETGDCDSLSERCTGDITYYDTGYPGYGSCGWITDGTVVPVIALPYEFMGTVSNGNPFCGRNVTINYSGKSVTAMVVDKCMGCTDRSIDLSHAAFDTLSSETIGRTQATWYFID